MMKLIRSLCLMMLLGCLAGCGGVRLPNTITSSDGSITANYPEGWVARADAGTLYMATSQAVLDNPRSVPTGEFVVAIGLIPDTMIAELSGSTGMVVTTPQVVLNVLGTRITGIDLDFTSVLGVVTTTTISERPAARANMTFTSEIGAGEGQIIVIDEGGNVYLVVIGSTLAGELSRFETTLLAIARSVVYQAVQGAPSG